LFLLVISLFVSADQKFDLFLQKEKVKFVKYQEKEEKLWNDYLKSTKTKWVEYDYINMSRSVVDFKKQEIVIDVVSNKNDKDGAILKINERLTKVLDKKNNDHLIVSDVLTVREYLKLKTVDRTFPIKEKDNGSGFVHYSVNIKLPSDYIQRKAIKYKTIIYKYSNKYGLDPSLVYSIIHSESSFNPMSESSVAYGIMQIVPKSAGLDVSKYLYGKEKLVTKKFLKNPENNILYGTTYLYLLKTKHFHKVNKENSKKYCMIAAYNTGPGNLLRTFASDRNIAILKINSFSDDSLKSYLVKNLPYDETKVYLKRVSNRIPQYNELIRLKKL